jgi:hypothetical protein
VIPKLTDEMSLITSIRARGIECRAFDGLTTHEQRREIVRASILASGELERFREPFAKCYGQSL